MAVNQSTRIERLKLIQKASFIDAFLFTSSSTITCLSGHFFNFEIGPNPFQLIPAALLMAQGHPSSLVLADNEAYEPCGIGAGISIKKYASYQYKNPLDYTAKFVLKLQEALKELDLSQARIGIEQDSLPYVASQAILAVYPNVVFVDVSEEVVCLKAVKDADEIDQIRKATVLCDIGQAAVLKHAKVGMTELELFSLIRTEMEATVGTRVPIMLDLVSGARTEEGGGVPSNNIIKEGDLVLSDLTPCLNGYWGDTCNTIIVGKPSAEQSKHFQLIESALQAAIDFIKPGVKANEVDQLLRKMLSSVGEYGHHSGHGVGTKNHEEPRIVPYNEMVIKENMVIALEPAIYSNGYGIRLEHLILVTQTGCETISKFKHCFEQKS
ncbi:aminopeptidase YpdF [Aquipluma nitroreducens]|uniref:Aminopeptidase YpdF n=1 Tax=Aquipluma nitroreducens TaxID=2010828 RepID=A0A5K7SAM0_9BACT|nr:Xaa-Pro peptidase family protein [Aquipluma nitroreducens]BBE18610.1 aminopeptidase YpdF [Aquipluma nitroreducens]